MFSRIRHLLLPHHSNNFKAKVLHADFFVLYVLAFFIISLSFRVVNKIDPNILGFATNIQIDALVNLTNQKRAESNLPALKFDGQLSQAAAAKANYMFEKNFWAHTSPDGKTPWDFINGSGYVYVVAGENLAKNFSDSEGVVVAWMNSPSHRENMLRADYQDVGFAVVNGVLNGEETTLVVQMFGKKLGSDIVAEKPETTQTTPLIPPPTTVQAQEQATPVAFLVQASPTPQPASLVNAQQLKQNVTIANLAGSVVKRPLFDLNSLSKNLLLGLSTFLMLVMIIDGVYIWRKKIARVSGRVSAHVLFLFVITGIVWFMSFGTIL